jgi:predicted PurR-regulated permease PerM
MLWLPIGVGILVNGNVSIGLLFILYNIITTGIISFFIGPRIVGRMAKIPEVIALIGMLGGGYLFGIIGVILGPLILGYLILFLEFFRNKKVEELFSWGK